MKKQLLLLSLLIGSVSVHSQEETEPVKEQSLKEKYNIENVAAPLVSSDPNFGNAIGFTTFTLIDLEEDVPSSTLSAVGLYSDRDSYFMGAFGKILPDKNWTHKFGIADMSIKKELELSEYPDDAKYTVDVLPVVFEPAYTFKNDLLAGIQLKFLDIKYTPDNASGEQFLTDQNAEDVSSLSLGVLFGYDSRDNPFYPSLGSQSRVVFNWNEEALGHTSDHYILNGFWNYYNEFKSRHTIATRLSGRMTPTDAPFSSLSTLGRQSDLRGYVAGENTANNLFSAQIEYRWQFAKRWALVGFIGEAALFDNGDFNSDSWYASGGGGIRFQVSEERKMNFRLDVAFGQGNSDGVYIGFREAF